MRFLDQSDKPRKDALRQPCSRSFFIPLGILLMSPGLFFLHSARFLLESSTVDLPIVTEGVESILDVPRGKAEPLPSLQVSSQENVVRGEEYGGTGDKVHLGGFTDFDGAGVSPSLWKWMVSYLGVKSVLDVGCGRGISTSWFALHGVETLCVEGSHDAYTQSLLPSKETRMVEHDFSRGPWWPEKTYDALWSVEFLEHVGRNFQKNYIPAFRKAALIFVTHSRWGGHHHVEVHESDWWITKMELLGFRYSETLSNRVHNISKEERIREEEAPNGGKYGAFHLIHNALVFINPMVAALPNHEHLMSDHGCFKLRKDGQLYNRECNTGSGIGKESPLPKSFYPLELTPEQDKEWEELIRKNVKPFAPKV